MHNIAYDNQSNIFLVFLNYVWNTPKAGFESLHVRMRMRGRVEVCRVEAPVEEGEEGGQAQHRHHHRDPHPPHHVARLYGVNKGRVEDPRREVEQEPTTLQFFARVQA